LGPETAGSREETVLRVEKEIAFSICDPQKPSYSQDRALVVLRSNSGYPLLVDPEQGAAAEHFGVLRARLLNARSKSGLCSVLISSPQQRDGKSFVSVNLAISLAQLQQFRILLVDGDMRLKGTTRGLQLGQETGLADFLQHFAPFEECVKATTLPHLHVAPAGNVAGQSLPAILQGARWPEFLQRGKQEFDLIIVDSVPVSAPVADFELSLNACDAALLVVHIRKTKREALELVTTQMQGKLLGVIVNNKDLPAAFGYDASYGEKKSK
jgi:capsular exopolysaccharide synthesis family protein